MNDPRMLSPNIAKMAIELLNRVPLQGSEVDAFCQIRASLRVVAEAPDVPGGNGPALPESEPEPGLEPEPQEKKARRAHA